MFLSCDWILAQPSQKNLELFHNSTRGNTVMAKLTHTHEMWWAPFNRRNAVILTEFIKVKKPQQTLKWNKGLPQFCPTSLSWQDRETAYP